MPPSAAGSSAQRRPRRTPTSSGSGPTSTFSADNYAAFAVMDGADPMNQRTNDVLATHVFLDWGTGRLGTLGELYIEKSLDPTAHLAVAMNGQLMGGPMPSPVQKDCYRGMLNAMLAAGLHSNWWLNWSQITPDDLRSVNEPARRLGPMFRGMRPDGHDVAVLWSQSEIIMRCKPLVARAAHLKPGEKMTRTIARLPENSATRGPVRAGDQHQRRGEQLPRPGPGGAHGPESRRLSRPRAARARPARRHPPGLPRADDRRPDGRAARRGAAGDRGSSSPPAAR